MTRIEPLNFSRLVSALRDRPGRISAAVVSTGSFDQLIGELRETFDNPDLLRIEMSRAENPLDLARQAHRLGKGLKSGTSDCIFLILADFPADSTQEEVDFWQGLNLQREALATGTVRTCFVLNEESARNFAQIADDLWSWASVYRLSDLSEDQDASLRLSGDAFTPPAEWRDRFTEVQLENLRDRLDRAQSVGFAEEIIIKSYAIPLFLATQDAGEACQIWQGRLRHRVEIEGLAPEYLLAIGQRLLQLAKRREYRDFLRDLVEDSLAATQRACTHLESLDRVLPQSSGKVLVEVFQAFSEAHQLSGDFREALKWTDRAIEQQGSDSETPESLQIQREAVLTLLQACEFSELPPLDRTSHSNEDEKQEVRSKSLGSALEISLIIGGKKEPDLIAHLFAAWVLSHRSSLHGPNFQEILEGAPEAYCDGVETIWLMWKDSPWEDHLRQPLAEAWKSGNESICPILRDKFSRWLLPPRTPTPRMADANSDLKYRRWNLQRLAIFVLGHRYEPEAIRILCDHIDSFEDSDEGCRDQYLAVERVGFMLRWSYQEPVLNDLRRLAACNKVSTSTALTEQLRLVTSSVEPLQGETCEPTFRERLQTGEADLLTQTDTLPTDSWGGSLGSPVIRMFLSYLCGILLFSRVD